MKETLGKSVQEFREALESFKEEYGDQFAEELESAFDGDARLKASKVPFCEMDEEGNIYADDYPYREVAAENCANL